MPRKPSAIVQYKLQIREALRRRIEQAARDHGVSANQEMVSRLERSFERETVRKLDLIAADLDNLLKYATSIATAPKGDLAPEQGVDVSKFKKPFLAPQRISDMDQEERQAFTVVANHAATPAPERAMADAKNITPDMLDLLKDEDLNNLENRKFVRAFIAELPATERGAMSSKTGGLSAEGLTRVRNAILAKAYGDPDIIARITESADDDVKSISNALVAAAPAWAELRADIEAGGVPPEFDLTPELVEAVKRTADLRSKGMKLEEYLAQHDALDHFKDEVSFMIRNFYDPNRKRAKLATHIADFLRLYANEAAKKSTEAGLGPGMPKVTPHDVLVALKQPRIRPKGAAKKKNRKGANQ